MLSSAVCVLALAACALGAAAPQLVGFPEGRIVGGVNAFKGQFPYQVSIQVNGVHWCGGVIISRNFVLTAGHCVESQGTYQVVAGAHNLKQFTGTEQSVALGSITVHPAYKPNNIGPNDIAVIRLAKALQFNQFVQAIGLPMAGSSPAGAAVLSGWGSTSTSSTPNNPDILQTISLPILSVPTCEQAASEGPYDRQCNICTGPLTGNQGFCAGDSGGPLAQNGVVVGIVSWGWYPCGQFGVPSGVFTRVSNYIAWIKQNSDA